MIFTDLRFFNKKLYFHHFGEVRFYVEKSLHHLAAARSNTSKWRRGLVQVELMACAVRQVLEDECGGVLSAEQIVSMLWPFMLYLRDSQCFVSVPDSEDCLTLFLKQGLGYAAGLDEQARSRLVLRPDYRRSGTGKGAGGVGLK